MSEWTLSIKVGHVWFGAAPDTSTDGGLKLGDEGLYRRNPEWNGPGRVSRYRIVRNAGAALTTADKGRVVKLSEDGLTILGYSYVATDKIAVLDDHLAETVNINDLCLVQVPNPGGLVEVMVKATGYNTNVAAGEKLGVTTGSGLTDTAAGRLAKLGDEDATPHLITQTHFRAVAGWNNLATGVQLVEIIGAFAGFATGGSS